jgi:molybdopterin-guanine dinucleotide biosynthesis protein A
MAGGKSSRMGTDKSFVQLRGKSLIDYVLAAVAGIGDETFIITNRPEAYRSLNLPTYGDILPEKGPLGGLYTAISRAAYPHVLVVACDMPWLNNQLLDHMIGLRYQADAIVPRWTKHPEPLHAIYSRSCLIPIYKMLTAGNLKMVSFYDQIDVRYVDRAEIAKFDPRGRSFSNVNSPEELEKADSASNE